MLSPMQYASLLAPTGEPTGDMISLGQRAMVVVLFIAPLLVIGICAFFRFEIGQVIEELGTRGIRSLQPLHTIREA